ncbi:MAG: GTP-binding protein, partial [Planctomycetota bacterium]
INFASSEVQCKVAYYGPAQSGKTANLRSIHERSPERVRGQLTTISTDTDRTLFFDYLPLNLGHVAGIEAKINIYAVPYIEGQNAVRSLVLEGTDGIVFVASSERDQLQQNREALENLRQNLVSQGRDLREIPLVFQWNKTDSPDALSPGEMDAALNPDGYFAAPSVATTGEGVFTCLKSVTAQVMEIVSRMMAMGKATISAQREAAEAPAYQPEAELPTYRPEPEPTPFAEPVAPPEPLPAPLAAAVGANVEPPFEEVPLPAGPAGQIPFEEVEFPPEEPASVPDLELPEMETGPLPELPHHHEEIDPDLVLPDGDIQIPDAPEPDLVREPLPEVPDLMPPGPDREPAEPEPAMASADLQLPEPPALVIDAARELEEEPEPVAAEAGDEGPRLGFPAYGGDVGEPGDRMVRVGGPSVRRAGWDQARDLKSRYERTGGQRHNPRPVVERRRRPRVADRSHIVRASYFVAGAACALIYLVTIGYLVFALL